MIYCNMRKIASNTSKAVEILAKEPELALPEAPGVGLEETGTTVGAKVAEIEVVPVTSVTYTV